MGRALVLILCLLAYPASAQLIPTPSTPDISVSATSTIDIPVHPNGSRAGPVDWFYIRNDCATDLYFKLVPSANAAADYSLRLGTGEVFELAGKLWTLGASNDGAATCTFTFQGAR